MKGIGDITGIERVKQNQETDFKNTLKSLIFLIEYRAFGGIKLLLIKTNYQL